MFDFILHFAVKKIVPPPSPKKNKKTQAELADFYIECHCEFKAFFSGQS